MSRLATPELFGPLSFGSDPASFLVSLNGWVWSSTAGSSAVVYYLSLPYKEIVAGANDVIGKCYS
jgi:hypothetical protein